MLWPLGTDGLPQQHSGNQSPEGFSGKPPDTAVTFIQCLQGRQLPLSQTALMVSMEGMAIMLTFVCLFI